MLFKFFWLLICYLDINECAKSPCKNGATCQNLPGSYRCNCKSGYSGRNCQTGELCFRLRNFIRNSNFHLAFIWICLIIPLPKYHLSWKALHCILLFVDLKPFKNVQLNTITIFYLRVFPDFLLLNTTSHLHIIKIVTFNNKGLNWGPRWKLFWRVGLPY